MKSFNTAWRNIRRSPYQAFAAILIMTLTFLVVSFFVFILVGSSKIVSYFESVPEVTAFFKNEASQEDINALENELSQTGKISSVKFVSKEEAVEIYKEQNKNDPILIEFVTADVLPASFEISAYEIEDLGSISEMLKKSLNPDGIRLSQSNGKAAGQEIMHFHLHVIPRYENDNMPMHPAGMGKISPEMNFEELKKLAEEIKSKL